MHATPDTRQWREARLKMGWSNELYLATSRDDAAWSGADIAID